jgi:hypothetical protein
MSVIKRQNVIAFVKGSTWGTAVEPSTGDQLPVENNSPPTGERNLVTSAEEYGEGLESQLCLADFPEQTGGFDGKIYVAQTKLMEILASIFGSYAFTVDDPVAGVNKHEFVGQRILSTDIFHTIAYDEGAQVKATDSAKFNSFVIALDQVYKHTTSYIGNILQYKSGFATPLSVTADPRIACFLNENTTVRINEQDAGALSVSDDQDVSAYGLSLERGYTSVPPIVGTAYVSDVIDNTQYIFAPTLEYPKKTAQNRGFLAEYQTGEIYKMTIDMIGPIITGATPYQLTFSFPQLYLMEAPVYDQETPEPTTAIFMSQWDKDGTASMDYKVPYCVWYNELSTLSGYPAVTET